MPYTMNKRDDRISHNLKRIMTASTASTAAAEIREVSETVDQIADLLFGTESTDARLSRLIVEAKAAKVKADAAAAHLAAVRSRLLDEMTEAGLTRFDSPEGKVSVSKGRRTIAVTDKALKAEIKLIQERGVRTGRCEVKEGSPFVTIR